MDVWQLQIPIRLALAQDEISSPGDVKPVYLLASRFAYLPALAQQSVRYFQHVLLSLPGQADGQNLPPTPWFEYKGLALSWTQPLGVLHDLLTPQPPQTPASRPVLQQQQLLHADNLAPRFSTAAVPWCLTVHYRNQPASLVNSWQNSGTCQEHFFSSLKEAGYCCRGTDGCNAVMRMSSQDEVWAAVNRGDAAAVQQQLSPLRLTATQRQGSSVPTVPVRLYIRQHKPDSATGLLSLWSELYSTTRAVEVQQPDGSSTLLAHLVHMAMPQRFPAPQALATSQQQVHASCLQQAVTGGSPDAMKQHGNADGGRPPQQVVTTSTAVCVGDSSSDTGSRPLAAPTAVVDGTAGDPLGVQVSSSTAAAGDATGHSSSAGEVPLRQTSEGAAAAAVDSRLPAQWPRSCAAYVCGIQPEWHTPLCWLHRNMKAADGFLYVVVHIQDDRLA